MSDSAEQITRDSLEAAFRSLRSDVNRATPSVLSVVAYAVCGVAAVLVLLSYIAGKRAGRKRSTIVEVRHI